MAGGGSKFHQKSPKLFFESVFWRVSLFNPLSPSINIHLLHTSTVLHTFLMVLLERICSNITAFHLWWSFFLILMTCLFDQTVLLLGKIGYGSLLELKGLSNDLPLVQCSPSLSQFLPPPQEVRNSLHLSQVHLCHCWLMFFFQQIFSSFFWWSQHGRWLKEQTTVINIRPPRS